eukprot:8551081-Heterocapsa_arctica.AAC.1
MADRRQPVSGGRRGRRVPRRARAAGCVATNEVSRPAGGPVHSTAAGAGSRSSLQRVDVVVEAAG